MRKILIIVILTHTFLAGQTWIVDAAGNGDFTDIQNAINNATDGDTIYVMNGTYAIFGVPNIEISIIGEVADSVKIVDKQYGIYISSSKRCHIKNLRFTGEITGAIFADAYEYYKDIQVIPELIIQNCVFDAKRMDVNSTSGIIFNITYEDMLEEGVIDTLEKRIKIINNTFIDKKEAILFGMGGIISNKLQKTTSFPIIEFDCRDNYYAVFDSVGIDSLVYDRRDPVDTVLVNSSNRALFNFVPWSDTLITKDYEITEGFRYNNFIDCEYAFHSYLIYHDSLVNSVPSIRLPANLNLLKAYPNPFNNSTTIEFFMKQQTQVEIKVFNIMGQELKQFYRKGNLGYGLHKKKFTFKNEPSGIYYVTLKTAHSFQKLKMLYLK